MQTDTMTAILFLFAKVLLRQTCGLIVAPVLHIKVAFLREKLFLDHNFDHIECGNIMLVILKDKLKTILSLLTSNILTLCDSHSL